MPHENKVPGRAHENELSVQTTLTAPPFSESNGRLLTLRSKGHKV